MSLHEIPAGFARAAAPQTPPRVESGAPPDERLRLAMRELVEKAQARAGIDVSPSLAAMAAVLAEAARPGAAVTPQPVRRGSGPSEAALAAAPSPAAPQPADPLVERVLALKRAARSAALAEAKALRAALREIDGALDAGRREACAKAVAALEAALAARKTRPARTIAAVGPRPSSPARLSDRVESGLAAAAREMSELRGDVASLARLIESGEARREIDERGLAARTRRLEEADRDAAFMAAFEAAARRLLDQIEKTRAAPVESRRGEGAGGAPRAEAKTRLEAALTAVQGSLGELSERLARIEAVPEASARAGLAASEPALSNESARFAPFETTPRAPPHPFAPHAGDAAADDDVLLEPGSGFPLRPARSSAVKPDERPCVVYPDVVAAARRAAHERARKPSARPAETARRRFGATAWLAGAAILSLAAALLALGAAGRSGVAFPSAALVLNYLGLDEPERAPAPEAAPPADARPPAPDPLPAAPPAPAPPARKPVTTLFDAPSLTARDSALRALEQGPLGVNEVGR